ncbi:hypothetical protein QSJ18_14850 [Gordonia sp. ABSL1-1]|uniref:hypothetical protein n=1 Tax=Gordonia sp. ABSL1-1 TaxID=3053923 RepID=UPI002572DAA4|nr:hypothetical protein [Gordonia sp. ABSL1-1]MDL9938029.1 hypothetical protein [Gordonia sp. ABSL1-1]
MTDDSSLIRRATLRTVLDAGEIRERERDGTLTSVWRGVVHEGTVPDDELDRYRLTVLGAALTGGPQRVVSHVSAAVLHRIPLLRPDLSRVHFTTGSTGRRSTKIHLHRGTLPERDTTVIDDVRVTTPARTVADVARGVTFEQAVCCLDSGLRLGASHDDITHLARACAGHKGAGRLRQALAVADGRSESVGESYSRALMIRLGIPMPDLQVEIVDTRGQFIARADFGWGDAVVGEFDGRVKYSGAFGQRPEDTVFAEKRREDAIRRTGRIVVRWTWQDLLDPPHFRRLIMTALRDAGLV